MKKTLWFALMVASATGLAQVTDDKKLVEATIETLFTAMKKGDSSLLRTAFADEVTMATIAQAKDGSPVIKREAGIANFMRAIGTPHPDAFNEPIWNLRVEVDGRFAQAWCDYAFYLGNKFSHCGVDAFHLFKGTDGNWRIFHLADTRRKDGCNVPESVARLFK
ncbi:MAG: nuclear transport factor 2 family protein [Flammeovirgaceae bacterium]